MSRTTRIARGSLAVVLAACVAAVLAFSASAAPSAPAPGGQATSSAAPIVGRWQQAHTCQELVDALHSFGLDVVGPAMVGDYFPDQTYDQLAAKPDLCSGAKPQQHSHFFTAEGLFGSVDQYGNQVDDGFYEMVDSDTFRIGGDATFDFSIRGDTLKLTPVITDKQRREALRHPEQFSTAGWMVAVSYPGTSWKRVPCQGWC